MYGDNMVTHRALMFRITMAYLAVAMISANSQAQLFYDFIEGGNGDVLATLELSSLPATHSEVVELTFTPTGETFFGYSSPYTGIFDGNDGPFVDDGMGGLDGGAQYEGVLWDGWNVPVSSHQSSVGTNLVALVATDGEDRIEVWAEPWPSGGTEIAWGVWRLVPEPTTFGLASIGLCLPFRRYR